MLNIGTRREVFFDDFIINKEETTAQRRINKPVAGEVVLKFDKPWEIGTSYIHFFCDEGKYRMYYVTHDVEKIINAKDGDDDKKLRCCYAESVDGVNWVKPNLGICEWNGYKENNIIFMAEWLDNFYVFKDENPACPPEQKYKAIVKNNSLERHCLVAYFSSDGIHFSYGADITDKGAFDTLNVIFWDENAKKYRGYIRSFHDIPVKRGTGDYLDYREYFVKGEQIEFAPGWDTDDIKKIGAGVLNLGKRDIRYIESEDFKTWTEPVRLDFGDKADIPLYTNCVSVYERAPHMFVGFPTRYNERKEWTKSFEVLGGKDLRRHKMENFSKREGLALTDCVFMCSRDGKNFTRYDEAFFKCGIENGTNWFYGDCYPARGFINGENEMTMFCPEKTKECSVLRKYTSRNDGFVFMYAGEEEKVLKTKPFVFEGDNMYVNIETSAMGYMYFEIEDADGNKTKSCEMFGNATDKLVGFEGALEKFSEKEVTLTVYFKDAAFYSMRFGK